MYIKKVHSFGKIGNIKNSRIQTLNSAIKGKFTNRDIRTKMVRWKRGILFVTK
mgnify:CR=1 FL=1